MPNQNSNDPAQLQAQILAQRKLAIAAMRERRAQIQKRIDALNLLDTQRELTDAEKRESKDLDAAMDALNDAQVELEQDILVALNQSAATKALATRLDGINSDLNTKIKKVAKIAGTVQQIADLFRMIDGIVASLTKLATLVV